MTRNLGWVDRFLRLIAGFGLLVFALFPFSEKAVYQAIALFIGAVLCFTAFSGWSPIYAALGISSLRRTELLGIYPKVLQTREVKKNAA